jgi:hypothetical protein
MFPGQCTTLGVCTCLSAKPGDVAEVVVIELPAGGGGNRVEDHRALLTVQPHHRHVGPLDAREVLGEGLPHDPEQVRKARAGKMCSAHRHPALGLHDGHSLLDGLLEPLIPSARGEADAEGAPEACSRLLG